MKSSAAATTLRTVRTAWSVQKNVICPIRKSGVKKRALVLGGMNPQ